MKQGNRSRNIRVALLLFVLAGLVLISLVIEHQERTPHDPTLCDDVVGLSYERLRANPPTPFHDRVPFDDLNKATFIYAAPNNRRVREDPEALDDFAFKPSLVGYADYLDSAAMHAYRESRPQLEPREIRALIREHTGYQNVPLGDVVAHETSAIEPGVEFHQIEFSSGASAQYYLATPKAEAANGRLLVALHGNSSTPAQVMGLETPQDYTNAFGRVAFENGYTVLAPYILSIGELVMHFESVGVARGGVTAPGYEMMKVHALVDRVAHSAQREFERVELYGISFGGIVALLLANLESRYNAVVASGVLYDFVEHYYSDRITDLSQAYRIRTQQLWRLLGHLRISDLVIALSPRRIILEVGSGDVHVGTDNEWKRIQNHLLDSPHHEVLLNYFVGYHEANPVRSIMWLRGGQ